MKTLISIMAHKEAEGTFHRHLALWQKLKKDGDDLIVWHPHNSKPRIPPGIQAIEVGKAQHSGVESIVRFRTILEHMSALPFERYVFFEYDSFCLGDLPDISTDVAGNIFRDNSPNRSFVGTMFCHPPLMFTVKGLKMLVDEIKQMPLGAENGVWDRWLGLAIERTGVGVFDFLSKRLGYSSNTIHENDFGKLRALILSGVKMFHGVKDKACYDIIMRAWDLKTKQIELEAEGANVVWK